MKLKFTKAKYKLGTTHIAQVIFDEKNGGEHVFFITRKKSGKFTLEFLRRYTINSIEKPCRLYDKVFSTFDEAEKKANVLAKAHDLINNNR